MIVYKYLNNTASLTGYDGAHLDAADQVGLVVAVVMCVGGRQCEKIFVPRVGRFGVMS